MNISFEKLEEKHRKTVIDIFNYYVQNSSAAYREKVVDYSCFEKFLPSDEVISSYAVLCDNKIVGFCTLEYYKAVSTFSTLGDIMYFLIPEATKKGIGKEILTQLTKDAKNNNIQKIVVDICDENSTSINFHKKNGFCEYGRLNKCWKKFGRELGLVFMEKAI